MKKLLVLLGLIFWLPSLQAAMPKVPEHMLFCDLELTLNSGARKYISDFIAKLQKSPSYFESLVDKSNTYMPIVESAFSKVGAPADLRYIVIQESAFNGGAVSKSGAVGFWQFKIPAAKSVGLIINRQIDERKHIYRSSLGAAQYFYNINQGFRNWVYAVIGYNRGPAGALSHINEKNYGKKRLLVTGNTHWYALKALAYKIAFQDEIGKAQPTKPIQARKTKGETSVSKLAKSNKLDLKTFKSYNLWIKGDHLPAEQSFTYYIPGKGKLVIAESAKPEKGDKPVKEKVDRGEKPSLIKTRNTRRYSYIRPSEDPGYGTDYVILKPGEKLVEVSVRQNRKIKKLREFNDLSLSARPQAGTMIALKKKMKLRFHIASKSDNWKKIASRYELDIKKLKKKNRTDELSVRIVPGQKIYLKTRKPKGEKVIVITPKWMDREFRKKTKAKKASNRSQVKKSKPAKAKERNQSPSRSKLWLYHTVRAEETLWSISQKHGVSVAQIKKLNGLKNNEILIGQRLKLKAK